uniref:Uncharacterized protein n=1 Tax=Anopheles culicifacies TaxID=139723 RepID=A0A182M2P0_9DIPT
MRGAYDRDVDMWSRAVRLLAVLLLQHHRISSGNVEVTLLFALRLVTVLSASRVGWGWMDEFHTVSRRCRWWYTLPAAYYYYYYYAALLGSFAASLFTSSGVARKSFRP